MKKDLGWVVVEKSDFQKYFKSDLDLLSQSNNNHNPKNKTTIQKSALKES